jgi:hypothetical protein
MTCWPKVRKPRDQLGVRFADNLGQSGTGAALPMLKGRYPAGEGYFFLKTETTAGA